MSNPLSFSPSEALASCARWCFDNPVRWLELTKPQMETFAPLPEIEQWAAKAQLKIKKHAKSWHFCFGEEPEQIKAPNSLSKMSAGNKLRTMFGQPLLKEDKK